MTAGPAVDELTEGILAIAQEVLKAPGLRPDDSLTLCGGSSLSLVRIMATVSDSLGVDVDPREVAGDFTARSLALASRPLP